MSSAKASSRKSAVNLAVGTVFGRYRIEQQLGEGAMGAVFLARDTRLGDRPVALKIPKFSGDERETDLQRFHREAGIAATMSHPNLCPVYDVGELDGTHYIAMGFIEGKPLNEVMGGRPAAEKAAALLVRKIALAMQTAHDKGVVHRDLKPANIMIDVRKEPIVMDFGLAKQSGGVNEAAITQSGMIIGTPAYMSPEQVNGELARIGPAADIYSLGVILYELLTGVRPFQGPITAVLGLILTKEPPPPSQHRPKIDPRLEAITLKAISKQIEDRYASMTEFAAALSDFVKQQNSGASVSLARNQLTDKDTDELSLDSIAALVDAARQCLKAHDYAEVTRLLESLPPKQRTPEIETLRSQAAKRQDEVDALLLEIELAVENRKFRALPEKLQRLLQLKPGHLEAKRLLERLTSYQGNFKALRFDDDGELLPAEKSHGLFAGFGWKYAAVIGVAIAAFGLGTAFVTYSLWRGSSSGSNLASNIDETSPDEQIEELSPVQTRNLQRSNQFAFPPLPKFLQVDRSVTWSPLEVQSLRSANGAIGKILPDFSLRVTEVKENESIYTLKARTKLSKISALKLAILTDGKSGAEQIPEITQFRVRIGDQAPLPLGPGLSDIASWTSRVEAIAEPSPDQSLPGDANIYSRAWTPAYWSLYNTVPRAAIFPLERIPQLGPADVLEISISHRSHGFCLKRFQLFVTDGTVEIPLDPVGANRKIGGVANDMFSVVGRGFSLQVPKGGMLPQEDFAIWDTHIGADAAIGADELAAFTKLDRLEAIILTGRNDAEQIISAVPFPMRVVLSSCPLTTSLATAVGNEPDIRELMFWGWKNGDDPAELIEWATPKLRMIGLAYNQVSPRAMRAIGSHTEILQVHFNGTQVSIDDLEPLWKLPYLHELLLVGKQRIDDAGLARLPVLPSLRKLGVQQPPVTDAAIEQLQTRMPWLEVLVQTDGKNRTIPAKNPQAASALESKDNAPPRAIAPFNAEQAKAHQEAWAKHLGVPVEWENSIGMKFRLIPPGEFTRGSTPVEIAEKVKRVEEGHSKEFFRTLYTNIARSEGPIHRVILTKPFYLGVHEVRQRDYQSVQGTNPSFYSPSGGGKAVVAGVDTSFLPVERVLWSDATQFCRKLSSLETLRPYYHETDLNQFLTDGNGYRLPTEAEWEFASRAGTITRFWMGDQEADLLLAGWIGKNSGHQSHPVMQLKANPFGLFDMDGNLWEWNQDWWSPTYYQEFQTKPAIDPAGPVTGDNYRIIRGGDFTEEASHFRATGRNSGEIHYKEFKNVGFRVAVSVDAVRQSIAKTGWPPFEFLVDEKGVVVEGRFDDFSDRRPSWKTENGELQGVGNWDKMLSFNKKSYGDFELTAEYKIIGKHGAVFIARSEHRGDRPKGYGVGLGDVDGGPHAAGTIYRWEYKSGNIWPLHAGEPKARPKQDEWTALEVTMRGTKLTAKINGTVVSEADDKSNEFPTGKMAFSLPGETVLCLRSVKVRELAK